MMAYDEGIQQTSASSTWTTTTASSIPLSPGMAIPVDSLEGSVMSSMSGTPQPSDENQERMSPPTLIPREQMYPVGSTVFLKATSQFYSQAPDNCPGVISSINDHYYHVDWENGHRNSYGHNDIQLEPWVPVHPAIGDHVMAIESGMVHYRFHGVVDKIDIPHKIWVRWSDGERTHTHPSHLRILGNSTCPDPLPPTCGQCDKACEAEIEHRKLALEAEKIAAEHRRIRQEKIEKYGKPVKVTAQVHALFMEDLKEFFDMINVIGDDRKFPFTHALGQNKDGIITGIHPIRGANGCKDMQYITPREMTQAYIALAKRKLTMVGLVKIGKFGTHDNFGFGSLYETNPDSILISINHEAAWVHSYIKEMGEVIRHEYIIVPNKSTKKGGDINGKSS